MSSHSLIILVVIMSRTYLMVVTMAALNLKTMPPQSSGPDHDDGCLLEDTPQVFQPFLLHHHIVIQGGWLHHAHICYGAVEEGLLNLGHRISVCVAVGVVLNYNVSTCFQQLLLVTRA